MTTSKPQPLAVLVTGGRNYLDAKVVYRTLTEIHLKRGIRVLVHGDCRGADRLAGQWAKDHGVQVLAFPITEDDMLYHGNGCGRRRNQRMLDAGPPDLVLAFPGGSGTRDMISRAKEAGVPVWRAGERAGERTKSPTA